MDVGELIESIRVRQAIWDQKSYDYKNRDVVKVLWEEVAAEFNQPLEKVRKRWKNLRDMFRNEMKRILLESGDTLPTTFTSTWVHFENMKFLTSQFLGRKTLRSVNLSAVDSQETSQDGEEYLQIPVSHDNFDERDEDNGAEETANSEATQQYTNGNAEFLQKGNLFFRPSVQAEPLNRKRKRESDLGQENENQVRSQSIHGLQVDDDYHFLISFLPIMKEMPLNTKMWFRLKAQELLYQCVIKEAPQGMHYRPNDDNSNSDITTTKY